MSLWWRAWQLFEAGGPVMWPLLVLSLWLWGLVGAKLLWLWRAGRESLGPEQAAACLRGGRPPSGEGPLAAALASFLARRGGGTRAQLLWWEAAVRQQVPLLWRHVSTVLLLAAVAPLLGLLGTVMGMIDTFQVIMYFGTGNAQALSAGISQALITTQTGLMVAIPGLFAGYFLRRRVRALEARLFRFQQAVGRWLREEA